MSNEDLKSRSIEQLLRDGHRHATIMNVMEQESRCEAREILIEKIRAMDDVEFLTTVTEIMSRQPHSRIEVVSEPVPKPGLATDMVVKNDPLGFNQFLIRAAETETVEHGVVEAFISQMQNIPTMQGIIAYKGILDHDTRAMLIEHSSRVRHRTPENVSILEADRIADLMIEHGIGVDTAHFKAYHVT